MRIRDDYLMDLGRSLGGPLSWATDESEKVSSGNAGSIGLWGVKSPIARQMPLAPPAA